MEKPNLVHTEVFKFDPLYDDKPRYVSYEVPYSDRMSVLDCLDYINEYCEPIAFQKDCRRYFCGSCTVNLNSEPILACRRRILPSELKLSFKIEPLTCLSLIKDLVVDFSEDMHMRQRVKPSAVSLKPISGIPLKLEKAQYDQQTPYALCVRCYACVEVCPAAKKTGGKFNPLVIMELGRLAVDKRDDVDRFSQAMKEGLLECRDCNKRCNQVCPAGLDVYALGVGRFIL